MKPFTGNKSVMKRYSEFLDEIKARVRKAQNRAVMSANAEMIRRAFDELWDGVLSD